MAKRLIPAACALLLAAAFVPVVNALTCYQCNGNSGIDTTIKHTKTYCGLPFRDNDPHFPLDKFICEGVCVTHTVYGKGGSYIYRSCTDLPVKDGCHVNNERQGSVLGWECIKTCKSDLCNKGNDASSLVASRFSALLLASAVAAFVNRFA